jgi:hypothetical protein
MRNLTAFDPTNLLGNYYRSRWILHRIPTCAQTILHLRHAFLPAYPPLDDNPFRSGLRINVLNAAFVVTVRACAQCCGVRNSTTSQSIHCIRPPVTVQGSRVPVSDDTAMVTRMNPQGVASYQKGSIRKQKTVEAAPIISLYHWQCRLKQPILSENRRLFSFDVSIKTSGQVSLHLTLCTNVSYHGTTCTGTDYKTSTAITQSRCHQHSLRFM